MKTNKILVLLYICTVTGASKAENNTSKSKILFTKNFTANQRSIATKCYKKDPSFKIQTKKLTKKGDVALSGMIQNQGRYTFFTLTNAYGSWMEYIPIKCDLRNKEQIINDKYKEKQRSISIKSAEKKNNINKKNRIIASNKKRSIKKCIGLAHSSLKDFWKKEKNIYTYNSKMKGKPVFYSDNYISVIYESNIHPKINKIDWSRPSFLKGNTKTTCNPNGTINSTKIVSIGSKYIKYK